LAITASALLAMLLNTGVFQRAQAEAVVAFAGINHYQPCAASWMGDGLFDVAGTLRAALHRETGYRGCVPPGLQVAFMVNHWKDRPCRHVFDAGDLSAFHRCWGLGHRS
jgi:hypothetical protein